MKTRCPLSVTAPEQCGQKFADQRGEEETTTRCGPGGAGLLGGPGGAGLLGRVPAGWTFPYDLLEVHREAVRNPSSRHPA